MKKLAIPAAFVAVLVILIFAASCKKEQEVIKVTRVNIAPVLTLEEPDDTSNWRLADSVHIEGNISDDDGLHVFSVIVSYMGDTVFTQFPPVHDLKTYDFHYHFMPSAAGLYYLSVAVEDHDSTWTQVSRKFSVAP
jgi:hypothetical protein